MTRNEAIRVSTRRLICCTETPKSAGPMSRAMRATPACARRSRGRTSSPSAARNGSWKRSWAIPATSTPQASATTGRSRPGATSTVAPISARLSSTGVKAGTAKRP